MQGQCEERDPDTHQNQRKVCWWQTVHTVWVPSSPGHSPSTIDISSWSQPKVTISLSTNRQLTHIICLPLGLMWTGLMPPCPQGPHCLCEHAYSHTHTECYTWKSSQPDLRLLSFRGLPTDRSMTSCTCLLIQALWLYWVPTFRRCLCSWLSIYALVLESLLGISGAGCFTLVGMTHAGRNKHTLVISTGRRLGWMFPSGFLWILLHASFSFVALSV